MRYNHEFFFTYLPPHYCLGFFVLVYLVFHVLITKSTQILFTLSKYPPNMLREFEVSISFHLFWRNSDCIVLVWLPCIHTGAHLILGCPFTIILEIHFAFLLWWSFYFLHPLSSSSLVYVLILKGFVSNNVLRKDA